jgi:hypothetical protein
VGVASVRFDTYLSIYTKGLEWSFYFRAPPQVVRVVSAAVNDLKKIWFDADRISRAEARAAARRIKNHLHVLPSHRLNGAIETIVIHDTDSHLRLHASITLAEIAGALRR